MPCFYFRCLFTEHGSHYNSSLFCHESLVSRHVPRFSHPRWLVIYAWDCCWTVFCSFRTASMLAVVAKWFSDRTDRSTRAALCDYSTACAALLLLIVAEQSFAVSKLRACLLLPNDAVVVLLSLPGTASELFLSVWLTCMTQDRYHSAVAYACCIIALPRSVSVLITWFILRTLSYHPRWCSYGVRVSKSYLSFDTQHM